MSRVRTMQPNIPLSVCISTHDDTDESNKTSTPNVIIYKASRSHLLINNTSTSPGKIPIRITDRFYGTFFNPVTHNWNPTHDTNSHKQRNSNNLVYIKCLKSTSSCTARSLPNVLVINSRSIRGKIEELVHVLCK